MEILNLQQGSPEWRAARAKHFTASEAPAMLGVSKYTTRAELLRQKATGFVEEVGHAQQAIFDRGHEAEALARPIVEGVIGEELYPATATLELDGLPLLASFDGVTMLEDVVWENKLLNQALVAAVEAGELDPHYWAQLEQQLLVSGAERALFTTSDGTEDGTHPLWYESQPERREQLIAGWKQFAEDLVNYQHVETAPEAVGRAPDSLPSLLIEVQGGVTASNLPEFKARALAVFGGINTDLQTDNDFADAEKTVKWCKEVEDKLKAAKNHALAQTVSIDELFRTIDDISAEARAKRLELDKLVKARKILIRDEILMSSKQALAEHVSQIDATLGGKVVMPDASADFAGAMKGKRTISSLRDAADTELANAKIAANQVADVIRLNLKTIEDLDAAHLFFDLQQVVTKQPDDFTALTKSRIADHERAVAEKEKERQAQLEAEKARATQQQAEEPSKAGCAPADPLSAPTSVQQKDEAAEPMVYIVLPMHGGVELTMIEAKTLLLQLGDAIRAAEKEAA